MPRFQKSGIYATLAAGSREAAVVKTVACSVAAAEAREWSHLRSTQLGISISG